jgi:tRNA (guanine6-N2)-methyltransferase
VLADEIGTRTPEATIEETARGKVYLSLPVPSPAGSPAGPTPATPTSAGVVPQPLFALRTADNLYRVLLRFRAGPHRADLPAVRAAVASIDLRGVVLLGPGGEDPARASRSPSFSVNASRAGRHTYSRFELAAAATAGILDRHPRWRQGDPQRHDLELRLDLSGPDAVLSLRLTSPQFRFRGARTFSPAALRPTIAHALVWLTHPRPSDTFLDPFSGSGTILSERRAYPARRLLGGDLDPDALGAARTNFALPPPPSADSPAGGAPPLHLFRWDARRLPFREATIDAVASNLPFGRQLLSPQEVPALYRDVARELERILSPAGRAVLLTDQVEPLLEALAGAGLRGEARLTLSLKGLHPQAVRITRG